MFTDTLDARIAGRLGDSVILSPGNTFPYRNDKTDTIQGKLDKQYLDINGVETLTDTFKFSTGLLDNVVHGSMVEDGSDVYKVIGTQPSKKITLLVLEKH